MTDEDLLEKLAEGAERILEETGFDPDGPLEQFNYASGHAFGRRLVELWPADPQLRDRVLRQAAHRLLGELQSIFPGSFDAEMSEIQAYSLGPLISRFITGRGLTVPQLAQLAGVTPERLYRLKRAGLSIIFEDERPPAKSGVNRRFSGLDGRQAHLSVDFEGIITKKWPEPVAFFQRFLIGILDGVRSWLESPEFRAALEDGLKRVIADIFADPILGDLLDGFVVAFQRITQRLRDNILVMKTEKDKAQDFLDMLVELSGHRSEVLTALAEAGVSNANEPGPLPSGGGS